MKLIATHNSCTSLPSKNFWHKLLVPFARCQSKTLGEQIWAGCTYFDIRVREIDHEGHYRICHGLWQSEFTLDEVMQDLTYFCIDGDRVIVDIFYEGKFRNEEHEETFLMDMDRIVKEYPAITFANIGVKKPTWTVLRSLNVVRLKGAFYGISWSSGRWILPIPFIWAMIKGSVEFNSDHYKSVDFL